MDDNLEVGEAREVARGVMLERRSFVALAGVFAAALPVGALKARAEELSQTTGMSFEEFLAASKPVAQALIGDRSGAGQARYLMSVGALAAMIRDVPLPAQMNDSRQGETPGTFIGLNPGGDPFNVLHWRFEPGARIRPHAHTYGNVVTVGLSGEVLLENFEVVGERDFHTAREFSVRRTHAQRLTQGAVNLVNLERDYIHGFSAGPEGATGLDITTRLGQREPTPYLIIPSGADRSGVFQAHWSIDDPMPMGA